MFSHSQFLQIRRQSRFWVGRLTLVCLFVWAATIVSRAAQAQQNADPDLLFVGDVVWGFDGRVPPHTFCPLWVETKNLSSTPWNGQLQLKRITRGSVQFGATLVESLALQGDETRWVQLVPYVFDDLEDWELSWGPEVNQRIVLPPVLKGERATVLIVDADSVSQPGTVFKRMTEERFPTSVTATDGLRGVILEHAPFWQGARARAFHDWLLTGGRVYLFHDRNGQFPVFPQALAFLNDERNQFFIGAGIVRKIEQGVDEISLDEARVEIFNDDWTQREFQREQRERQQARVQQSPRRSGWGDSWFRNQDLFRQLRDIAKFQRRWLLIYFAVLAYLATIYPGCFLIGTQQKNVAGFYLAFFTAVVFFAAIFSMLGQVGTRAENRIRTVALARSLGAGSFDVTGWSVLANVFSGEQTLVAPGSGVLYSTAQESEFVAGSMHPGPGGQVNFEMLPDSHRTLLHRARIRTELRQPIWLPATSESLMNERLTFDITGAFPEEPIAALAVYQGLVYELSVNGNLLELRSQNRPVPLSAYLQRTADYRLRLNMWGNPVRGEEEQKSQNLSGVERYLPLVRTLAGNSFGLRSEIEPRLLKLDQQTVRLFVLTAMTQPFDFETEDFPDQEGAVLFAYDLKR